MVKLPTPSTRLSPPPHPEVVVPADSAKPPHDYAGFPLPGEPPSCKPALQQISRVETATNQPVITRANLAALLTLLQDPGATVCPRCRGPLWVDHPPHCIIKQLLDYDPDPTEEPYTVGKQS